MRVGGGERKRAEREGGERKRAEREGAGRKAHEPHPLTRGCGSCISCGLSSALAERSELELASFLKVIEFSANGEGD